MATLHLTLKKCWFDMALSGEKLEEYREIKPYKVLDNGANLLKALRVAMQSVPPPELPKQD